MSIGVFVASLGRFVVSEGGSLVSGLILSEQGSSKDL